MNLLQRACGALLTTLGICGIMISAVTTRTLSLWVYIFVGALSVGLWFPFLEED